MTSFPARLAVERSLSLAAEDRARNVFTKLFADEARALAEASDVARPAHPAEPLSGIPVTVKDNIDLIGRVTTAGSTLLGTASPARDDAPVVRRLRQAGLVILGHTNMTEFAFSGLGLNPHYGTPLNPAFPAERRIPGGSSSGAAVSVALGMAPFAVGTDTGGSVRIPAAFCGLAGFKPSAGAISREGVIPLSTTLDTVGLIGRNVSDCATLFDIVRDRPGDDRPSFRPGRLRLGLVDNYVTRDMDAHVADRMDAAIAALADAGIAVERISLPELDDLPVLTRTANFSPVEAYAWHARFLKDGRSSEYDPRVLKRIAAGEAMRAHDYVKLLADRRALMRSVAAGVAGLDALLWPTVPIIAPTFDQLAEDEEYHAINMLVLRNSSLVNMLDGCAVSLPCPTEGAPVGLTIAAMNGRDDHLLGVARLVERVLGGGGQVSLNAWLAQG